jgi:hypothetical protein
LQKNKIMEKYLEYLKSLNNINILEAIKIFEDNKVDENYLSKVAIDNEYLSYRTFLKSEKIKKILE